MRGIGQLARESGLTVSALRFYDGAGVLVPARVDPQSFYRSYSDDQVAAARLLAQLRRVGMPLDGIREVLAHRGDPPAAQHLLAAHLRRLEDGLADARRALSTARSLLVQESTMTHTATHIVATAAAFRHALSTVRHVVGTDPELPMLTGVFLDADGATVRVVGTDRFRLAVHAVPDAVLDGPPVSVLLPLPLVDQALETLGETAAPVAVDVRGDEISIQVGNTTLRGRAVDADFPDYRRIVAPASGPGIDLDVARFRSELIAAVPRTVTDDDGTERAVTVLRVTDDGRVGVSGGADGPGLDVGVNREFLLQALDAGGAGQLVLDLDGPVAPLVLRDPARTEDLRMLMPIRLP